MFEEISMKLVPAFPIRSTNPKGFEIDGLQLLRQWVEDIEIHNPKVARLLCKIIPAQCPFERDLTFFGHTVLHIPPLCKLNPLYMQFISLRFKSLTYLADVYGEDVTPYCQ
jgi:Mo-dependent nitrogenase C-terminus